MLHNDVGFLIVNRRIQAIYRRNCFISSNHISPYIPKCIRIVHDLVGHVSITNSHLRMMLALISPPRLHPYSAVDAILPIHFVPWLEVK